MRGDDERFYRSCLLGKGDPFKLRHDSVTFPRTALPWPRQSRGSLWTIPNHVTVFRRSADIAFLRPAPCDRTLVRRSRVPRLLNDLVLNATRHAVPEARDRAGSGRIRPSQGNLISHWFLVMGVMGVRGGSRPPGLTVERRTIMYYYSPRMNTVSVHAPMVCTCG